MTDDNTTVRTRLGSLEEIAARHGIDPDTLRGAVERGDLREHRQPGDPRTILAERDVLVWMGSQKGFEG